MKEQIKKNKVLVRSIYFFGILALILIILGIHEAHSFMHIGNFYFGNDGVRLQLLEDVDIYGGHSLLTPLNARILMGISSFVSFITLLAYYLGQLKQIKSKRDLSGR